MKAMSKGRCKTDHDLNGRDDPWCFIGCDQDQGILMHMAASLGADGNNLIKSSSVPELGLNGDHFAFHPKPWAGMAAFEAEAAKTGGVLDEIEQKHVATFWAGYQQTLRSNWEIGGSTVAGVCNEIMDNLFHEITHSKLFDQELILTSKSPFRNVGGLR